MTEEREFRNDSRASSGEIENGKAFRSNRLFLFLLLLFLFLLLSLLYPDEEKYLKLIVEDGHL